MFLGQHFCKKSDVYEKFLLSQFTCALRNFIHFDYIIYSSIYFELQFTCFTDFNSWYIYIFHNFNSWYIYIFHNFNSWYNYIFHNFNSWYIYLVPLIGILWQLLIFTEGKKSFSV